MNPVSDLKSIPPGGLLSPEANATAALAAATATSPGILAVDLDAIVANWLGHLAQDSHLPERM